MRIRSNTCLWGIPPAYSGRGRPRKHGEKFQLTNSENWTSPDSALELDTSSHGRVRVRMWKDLHFSGICGSSDQSNFSRTAGADRFWSNHAAIMVSVDGGANDAT